MSRDIKVTTIQPPVPHGNKLRTIDMINKGLELLEESGKRSSDISCLPEYFNVFGLSLDDSRTKAISQQELILKQIIKINRKFRMYTVLSVMEKRGKEFYNTGLIIDREGVIIGRYDKTHLTPKEKEESGITPGDTYPVFHLDFGRVGIMICYDIYFPETARILTLNGAEIIFFPSLQRHITEDLCQLQVRARAFDYSVYIVRSSYGHYPGTPWMPGMMIGKSCIVNREGTIIADTGHYVGITSAGIDLDEPILRETSAGGKAGDPRKFMVEDRREETYARICQRRVK